MRVSLEQHLGSRQVGRVVYGSIIGMALVVTLDSHPPTASVMTLWLLGTALAVALAEVYSEVVGAETSTRRPVRRPQLHGMIEDAVAVGFGVAFPAVFFLLAVLGLLSLEAAFAIAKWSGVVLIGFYGYWAARFSGATRGGALLKGGMVALVGVGLIALKALVH
jgi:hypothetical protein